MRKLLLLLAVLSTVSCAAIDRFGRQVTSLVPGNGGVTLDELAPPARPAGWIGPSVAGSPATRAAARRLVVDARLVTPGTISTPQSIAPYRHALVVSEYEIVNVLEGAAGERRVLVAQWAIRDGRILAGAQRTVGSVHRLALERYEAHPELEGERLVMERDAPGLPLYYDVVS